MKHKKILIWTSTEIVFRKNYTAGNELKKNMRIDVRKNKKRVDKKIIVTSCFEFEIETTVCESITDLNWNLDLWNVFGGECSIDDRLVGASPFWFCEDFD